MSVQEALELEQPELMPLPGVFDGYIEFVARVSSTCLVSVKRNRYSVPCRFANRRVRNLGQGVGVGPPSDELCHEAKAFSRHVDVGM